MTLRTSLAAAAILALAGTSPALAAYQTCGRTIVDIFTVRCPDGGIPSYQPGAPPTGIGAGAPGTQPSGNDAKLGLTGVWHTNRAGMSFDKPFDVPGAYQLDTTASTRAGDLTIAPNGKFVWNTYRGTAGTWVAGNGATPIILFDNVEHKRHELSIVDGRLRISDGTTFYTGSR